MAGLSLLLTAPIETLAATSTTSSQDKELLALFKAGDYPAIVQRFQALPKDATPSKDMLRLTFQSFVKLGRGEEALPLYPRIKTEGQPDDLTLVRPLALSLVTSRVRDQKEHVRIAAYTVLAELGLPETGPLLEDGLLNSSVLVRARAAEAIGRAGLAAKSGALKRAINDEAPSVRIAAMNALEKSLGKLQHLAEKDREQVAQLTQSLVNKILHSPLTVLKESSQTPDAGVTLEGARKLFNLTEPPAGQGGTESNGAN